MRRPVSYSGKYTWIWEKYRPIILRLMIASSESPQEYRFSSHEFKDSNNKRPGGYTFKLRAYMSRSQNNITKSLIAQDLLYMLRGSNKAEELMQSAIYEFDLDKHFVLQVKQIQPTPSEDSSDQN